jgi:hypothetical protein
MGGVTAVDCNGTADPYWSARRIRAALFAAVLTGCVPGGSGTYLRPAYPDPSSVLTRSACGGQAGQPAVLTFTAPGEVLMKVSTQASEARGQGWLVIVDVTPPAGTRFRFLRDTVEIGSSAGSGGALTPVQATAIASQRLEARSWVDIEKLGPTTYETAKRAFAEKPTADLSILHLGSGTVDVAAARVRVELPAVQTARQRIEAPPQLLAAEAESAGYQALRTSEYAAELSAREAQCREQTPQRACENLARLDPYSFRHESGAFTWLGRFWTVRGEAAQTLRFELLVHARTTEPWRIAEPIVRLTDEATGETTAYPLEAMEVSLRYAVPLDARLQGRSTSLSIALPLRETGSRTFLQLPPYDVNGMRHEMQSIELQRRRGDGGLQPADC